MDGKDQRVVAARAREVKCFKCLGHGHYANQCPNQRAIYIREDRGLECGDEVEEEEEHQLA